MPQTYTDAELLVLARAQYAAILGGSQAYSIDGRQLTRADLVKIQDSITWLEKRLATTGDGSGNGGIPTNLAKFDR